MHGGRIIAGYLGRHDLQHRNPTINAPLAACHDSRLSANLPLEHANWDSTGRGEEASLSDAFLNGRFAAHHGPTSVVRSAVQT